MSALYKLIHLHGEPVSGLVKEADNELTNLLIELQQAKVIINHCAMSWEIAPREAKEWLKVYYDTAHTNPNWPVYTDSRTDREEL